MNVIELFAPRLDAFRAARRDVPYPRRGEVLLRMRAASLNFLDIAVATGQVTVPAFPLVPVTDGAGEVVAIGDGVQGWTSGQRVIPHFMPGWLDGPMTVEGIVARRGLTLSGSLAEYIVAPASSLVAVPDHLTDDQAATLPIAATTAWRAVRAAALGPGSTALLLGTGGVAIFALQFAKALGARVIITSSSEEKLERASRLGADATINYRRESEWDERALRLTGGRGADLVLEAGGAETFRRSINAVALGGTVFVIGFLSGTQADFDVIPVIEKAVRIQGNNAGPVIDLREAANAIDRHRIEPVVDDTFEMRDAAAAYGHLGASQHFGKITISVG